MSEPRTISVDINGFPARVWQKGEGPKLGFLAGFGGLPRWVPFLDVLARERTVIVPSLPGFPGGDRGHSVLDSHLDWVLAVRQLLQKAGLDGADIAGGSVGGSFAAEIAAIWPASVRRLALIAPWGMFDDKGPPTDPWAQRPPEVPGPDRPGQPVLRVVRDPHRLVLVAERHHAQHRPEDLLTESGRIKPGRRQHRGREPESGPRRRRPPERDRPVVGRHVPGHPLPMRGRD